MSLADPRMSELNDFTSTTHGEVIPPNLTINEPLPSGFTALILGASEGIGESIALRYANAGASHLIITARGQANLEKVRNKIVESSKNVKVEVHTCDISSASSMETLSQFVHKQTNGRLDCVIVNAAYAPPVLLKTHLDQPEDVQRAFDVNAMGTFHAAHYFVPLLLSSQECQGAKQFIAVGSMAAQLRRGAIANMGYCVSKMAQNRMIEYLMEQYADQGLFAVAVHPGAVNTSMAKGNTPEVFIPYLVDDVALCGAFCVWLSRHLVDGHLRWLNGRFVSATWDVDELSAKEKEIVNKDLLKFAMILD